MAEVFESTYASELGENAQDQALRMSEQRYQLRQQERLRKEQILAQSKAGNIDAQIKKNAARDNDMDALLKNPALWDNKSAGSFQFNNMLRVRNILASKIKSNPNAAYEDLISDPEIQKELTGMSELAKNATGMERELAAIDKNFTGNEGVDTDSLKQAYNKSVLYDDKGTQKHPTEIKANNFEEFRLNNSHKFANTKGLSSWAKEQGKNEDVVMTSRKDGFGGGGTHQLTIHKPSFMRFNSKTGEIEMDTEDVRDAKGNVTRMIKEDAYQSLMTDNRTKDIVNAAVGLANEELVKKGKPPITWDSEEADVIRRVAAVKLLEPLADTQKKLMEKQVAQSMTQIKYYNSSPAGSNTDKFLKEKAAQEVLAERKEKRKRITELKSSYNQSDKDEAAALEIEISAPIEEAIMEKIAGTQVAPPTIKKQPEQSKPKAVKFIKKATGTDF